MFHYIIRTTYQKNSVLLHSQFTKYSYFLEAIYLIDKLKLILYPPVRNSATHLNIVGAQCTMREVTTYVIHNLHGQWLY